MLYHHLPHWPEDRIRPLMETFGSMLMEQRVYREVFGVAIGVPFLVAIATTDLATREYTNGKLRNVFDSRKEITDAIKRAVEDIALNDCPRCDKLLERD